MTQKPAPWSLEATDDRTIQVVPGLGQTQNVEVLVTTYLNDFIKLVEQ